MSQVMSVRLVDPVADRLRDAARVGAEPASSLAAMLIDEGLRMLAHPSIVFRPGPAGRRAALIGGPDVWEVVSAVRDQPPRGEAAVRGAATQLDLPEARVRAALEYYGAFPAEIDDWIAVGEHAAEQARAGWEAQQRLLA